MENNLVYSLDIGSSKTTALVGKVGASGVEIVGIGNSIYAETGSEEWVVNGVILNFNAVAGKIKNALNCAQVNADCTAGDVVVNISGDHVRSIYTCASLDLSGDEVTQEVIDALHGKAMAQLTIPDNYTILSSETQEYVINNLSQTRSPLYLNCDSISCSYNLVVANKNHLSNICRTIVNPYNVGKVIPSAILSALAVLSAEEKEIGVCLIDIGASLTDIVVYQGGLVRYAKSFPFGGKDITFTISDNCKIPRNSAEDIKITHGGCTYSERMHSSESISVLDYRGHKKNISRKFLIKSIITPLKELFSFIQKDLQEYGVYDIIPAGFVLTGGTAELHEIKILAEQLLMRQVNIGIPRYTGEFEDLVRNPKYATSVGGLMFVHGELDYNVLTKIKHQKNDVWKKIKNLISW